MRANGVEIAARVRAMPAEAFAEGSWENGWNGRQILAHVASIEWTYPRLLDLARIGGRDEAAAAVEGFDIDAYNQRQVDKRVEMSVEDLVTEFERNRAATIAAIESAPDELCSAHIRTVGGIEGTLIEVLNYVAVVHTIDHINAIEGTPQP
ncbi:MAG: maleylpyruvate isomerase N-terminal domain-containing protein [Candidatus Dormibacteria bacterium]